MSLNPHLVGGHSKRTSWYYYFNQFGANCSLSVTGFIAQDEWVYENRTQIEVDGKMIQAYQFSNGPKFVLYTTVTPPLTPLLLTYGKIGSFFDGMKVYFVDYQVVTEPFPDFLFKKPSFCHVIP
jgi:hypothetical protein